MRQAGVMTDHVETDGQVRTSDLENGSSNRHSIHDFYRFEGAGSDADQY